MHAHSDYTITLKGSEEEKERIVKCLEEIITDVDFAGSDPIEIMETYKCVFDTDIIELSRKMAKSAPDAAFIMNGCIDASESAGEYMDFRVELENGALTSQFSDWYLEEWMENYEDYEDFCDNLLECTESEYEEFSDNERVYIIETEAGDVLALEVPLKEKVQIEF